MKLCKPVDKTTISGGINLPSNEIGGLILLILCLEPLIIIQSANYKTVIIIMLIQLNLKLTLPSTAVQGEPYTRLQRFSNGSY